LASPEPPIVDAAAGPFSLPIRLAGAVGWGGLMAVSAAFALYRRNGLQADSIVALLLVYFLGGALAWPFALKAARICGAGKPVESRFAACLLCLSIATMAMTAFTFAIDYRIFYARWHAPFGSIIWMFQFAYTGASAVYQFGVLGSRLFLPLGLIWLPAASLYLARQMR
jgi:hypothetical protein